VLELTVNGGPGIRAELGDADFFDLHHSVFFNSLPVARDGLLEEGAAAREYTMCFVRVPELTAEQAWRIKLRHQMKVTTTARHAAGPLRAAGRTRQATVAPGSLGYRVGHGNGYAAR
jgi:hypothetical protein